MRSARFSKWLWTDDCCYVVVGLYVFDHFHGLVKLIGSVYWRRVSHWPVVNLWLRFTPQKRRRLFAVYLFDFLYYLLNAQNRIRYSHFAFIVWNRSSRTLNLLTFYNFISVFMLQPYNNFSGKLISDYYLSFFFKFKNRNSIISN